jgi:hypothetical protein
MRRGRTTVLAVAALAASACSGGGTPPATSPAGSSAPAGEQAPTDPPPTATILQIKADDSGKAPSKKVSIEFKNAGRRTCRYLVYRLVWKDHIKEVDLDKFSIPPGQSRERSLRIHPEDGDLASLTMENARVEASTECK